MSYGLDPYGLSPYGGITLGISVASAEAFTTREVRVRLTAEPRHIGDGADGDALAPATWTVRRLDDGFEFTVIGAGMVDQSTVGLLLFEPLGPFAVQHSADAFGLLSSSGEAVTSPTGALFRGVVDRGLATPQAQAATRRFGQRDLANPPLSGDSVGGTLRVGPSGDYRNEEGAALVRKLIVRRLVTRRGELFWAPEYGAGIAEKEAIPGNLVAVASDTERQLLGEPDVEAVRVTLDLDASGILTVGVAAKLRQTGQEVQVSYAVPREGER